MGLIDLHESKRIDLAEGVFVHAVSTESMTVAHVHLKKGAVVPKHSHVHEQIVNVVEGALELTVEGEEFIVTPGKVLVLEPSIPHSARALTDCLVLDVFHPVREDFR